MSKPFILLIDDDKAMINSLMLELKTAFGQDYTIEATQTISEARQLIHQLVDNHHSIKLIVADWLLSGTDRINDFLSEIYSKYPDIPIVMLSGFADVSVINDLRQRGGIVDFIPKPYEEGELIEKLKNVLGK